MKNIFKIAIILALTFIIIQVEKDFKNREFFNISKVQISEVSPNLKSDLEKIKKQILGKNINDLNLEGLENKLLKDVRIKKAVVSKQNLNEITIDIIEKESSYYAQHNSRIYTMDEQGTIFGKLDEYPKKSMPILVLKEAKEKEHLLEIMEKLKELDLKDEVSQLYAENKNLIYIILRDGTKIKTEPEVSKKKYEITMNLYKELIKAKEIDYIDIRFTDIVVREKEGKSAR
ncbi:MAG: cell division protein FtsQ/DivIB [Cetobacterium sp.]|uniref:cell division protein FtsQ/DivIB n=1 Tax=Cetobacterium TaxID=180162 RepID=UPI001F070D9D|nr:MULTISPECIES: cell division protein FtsQ/DivIB [Cetobacterium]MCX3067455.1 cell division protein FtsQ/DivIB [Cetobacterium somerae]UPO97648.1 cell division protein FtsQ/DivIB [Cetobacterium somerae]WVJ00488.1 cell division protein FtsQ/DivIB [Cetobacterium somerae]